jgi:hypothetical protein
MEENVRPHVCSEDKRNCMTSGRRTAGTASPQRSEHIRFFCNKYITYLYVVRKLWFEHVSDIGNGQKGSNSRKPIRIRLLR